MSHLGANLQTIAALAGVLIAGGSALLGHFVPIWARFLNRWMRDRVLILKERDTAIALSEGLVRERDRLYQSLTAAAQGASLNHDLYASMQERLTDVEARLSDQQLALDEQRLAFAIAIKYIADLIVNTRNGVRDLPPPPDAISDKVQAEIAARIEQRKHPATEA